ncbi:hypothetical protein [Kaistia defluvii]|uniref:hypothetical protein n=1 Tax=Kaistia defluvii TaxID=410841 RepID=UPI00225BD3C2|nr:hypothetical protein [Kaistia defluvii]
MMTIHGLFRTLIEWAVAPEPVAHNANAVWDLTVRELADLPIGPEAVEAPQAFQPQPDSRCA